MSIYGEKGEHYIIVCSAMIIVVGQTNNNNFERKISAKYYNQNFFKLRLPVDGYDIGHVI